MINVETVAESLEQVLYKPIQKRAYLGIDPGIKGGAVLILPPGGNGVPIPKTYTFGPYNGEYVVPRFKELYTDLGELKNAFIDVLIAVEKVHAAPGNATQFTQGEHYGKAVAMAQLLPSTSLYFFTPNVWQTSLGLANLKLDYAKRKQLFAKVATEMVGAHVRADVADAFLIALALKRKNPK